MVNSVREVKLTVIRPTSLLSLAAYLLLIIIQLCRVNGIIAASSDQSNATDYVNATTRCYTCKSGDLNLCAVLAGREIVVPNLSNYSESIAETSYAERCGMLEKQVTAVQSAAFGEGGTFHNTAYCEDLVTKFHCLMLANVFNTCPSAPLPPCRSLCMEIATKCVPSFKFVEYTTVICSKIACDHSAGNDTCIRGSEDPSLLDETYDICTLGLLNPVIQRSGASSQIGRLDPVFLISGHGQACIPALLLVLWLLA